MPGLTLKLNVVEAKDLQARDENNLSDPYVKIQWNGSSHRSPVIKKTLKPVWNFKIDLPYDPNVRSNQLLTLKLRDWDEDGVDRVGQCTLALDGIKVGFSSDKWYNLDNSRGRVRMVLTLESSSVDHLMVPGKHAVPLPLNRPVMSAADVDAASRPQIPNRYASHQEAVSRLLEMMPQCPVEKVVKALEAKNWNEAAAIEFLCENLISEASEEKFSKSLFESQVLNIFRVSAVVPSNFCSYEDYSPGECPKRLGWQAAPQSIERPIRSSGRRKAVLVGIDYVGAKEVLSGCGQDCQRMKKLITQVYGFPSDPQSLVILTDQQNCKYKETVYTPTKANLIKSMKWLVTDVKEGDVLFFHFSGHGTQKRDTSGDETDGLDEAIMPCDFRTAGCILDDEMSATLVEPLTEGVKLTIVLDCCHSGTGMDLPFQWDANSRSWREDPHPILSAGDVQLISGCKADQTSADVDVNQADPLSAAGGAMTLAMLAALSSQPFGHSFESLMRQMEKALARRSFPQRPQLASSQKFEALRPFSLVEIMANRNSHIGRHSAHKKQHN